MLSAPRSAAGFVRLIVVCGVFGVAALGACSDQPVGVSRVPAFSAPKSPAPSLAAFDCTATRTSVSCKPAASPGKGSATIIGGQHTYVNLTSSNVSYDSQAERFQFDVTVQNLLNESIGTPNGVVADTNGIRVFFASGPTVTQGSGTMSVANADGTDLFTNSGQPYFRYSEILAQNAVSSAKTWQLNMPATVEQFTFTLYVSTEVQPLLVINELLANPNGIVSAEQPLEWVELYNAGTLAVTLNGMVFADSSASGRRPYNVFDNPTPLVVQPGAYFTLGGSTNTTANGGAPIDYSYGTGMSFANSLDAFKLARVYGTDTVTIDRTQYSSASVSAKEGVSRELKNPALDNSNMDGSNWGDASVTSVYGSGGRGTPKAQNSDYTP
jgi:hypothetical protein